MRCRYIFLAPLVLAAAAHAEIPLEVPPQILRQLRTFNTPHYMMFTDISEPDAREADLRMTRMFEEYERRTAGFSGQVNGKFPFFLFKNPEDYYAAGAIPDSDGVFVQAGRYSRLMAIAGKHANANTWHVVQHEGFHQFAVNTIRGELPIWVNEGLAEYFGEAIWTGDSFVTGIIPRERLKEVRAAILHKRFKPFDEMMNMTSEEWGSHLEYANYNQAWSMVQFLAHGDNGRFQQPFVRFMQNLNRGVPAASAWNSVFGNDPRAFEAAYTKWWLSLPADPSHDLYVRAAVSTLTSFLARATLQKQHFSDVHDFVENVKLPDLTAGRDIWLPPDLFTQMKPAVEKVGTWTLENRKTGFPRLLCTSDDGARFTGIFSLNAGRIQVIVNETHAPATAAHPAHR